MEPSELIAQELERRGWHPGLQGWIEDLCAGREDRTRLRCCRSGCLVCKQEILAIVAKVEAAKAAG